MTCSRQQLSVLLRPCACMHICVPGRLVRIYPSSEMQGVEALEGRAVHCRVAARTSLQVVCDSSWVAAGEGAPLQCWWRLVLPA